jgi:hypothetical protein
MRAKGTAMDITSSQFLPRLSFEPVNKRVARRYLYFLTSLSAISGLGKWSPDFWDKIPLLMDKLGLRNALIKAGPMFIYALVFSIVGFLLLVFILTKLMNAQFVLSLAKCLFLLSLFYLVWAFMLFLPESLSVIPKIFLALVLLFGIVHCFFLGMMRYYWEKRRYGDVFMEITVLILFLAFMWKPMQIILVGSS